MLSYSCFREESVTGEIYDIQNKIIFYTLPERETCLPDGLV